MPRPLLFVRARPRALLAALSLLMLSAPAVPVQAATTGALQTYIVTYRAGASSSNAASVINGAGGAVVYNYREIGVVIARSDRTDFASNVRSATGVDGAVATARFATRVDDTVEAADAAAPTTSTASTGDPLTIYHGT